MKPLIVTKDVAAPPAEVFRVASDFAGAADRIRGITRVRVLTDGPLRVGTRFEETRRMFGREATETMEITELDPPRSYVLGATNHGCRYRSELRFEPQAGGTRVTMSFSAEPLTVFAKIMSVLMAPMAKALMKECSRDLDDLAAACEGRGGG